VECGLRLELLPAQDMFDITHYFFETDNLGTKEEQDAKLDMRRMLYRDLYDRPYSWMEGASTGSGKGKNAGGQAAQDFGTQEVGGAPTKQLSHKPFVPATPMDPSAAKPFGDLLDAPLG